MSIRKMKALRNESLLIIPKMDSEATKQFMMDNHPEEPLKLAGDWKVGLKFMVL